MAQRSQNWLNDVLRTLLLLLVVAAIGALLFYMLSPTQTAVDRRSTINVTGDAIVETQPDRAVVTFEVVADGSDAAQADALNQQRTATLVAALKAVLLADDTLETVNYSVYPRYETVDGERRQVGQRASQSIKVTFNGLDESSAQDNGTQGAARVGQTIALGLESGATGVSGPQFSVSENNPARAAARALSVKVAQMRAQQLAKQAGVTLRALHYIKDSENRPIVFSAAADEQAMQRSTLASSAIVPPKETQISHSVEASYYVS